MGIKLQFGNSDKICEALITFCMKIPPPPEIEQRRKMLYPILSAAKKLSKFASINYDKLYVDGKMYRHDELHKQPDNLKPEKIATRTQNGIPAFFIGQSPFSNYNGQGVEHPEGTYYQTKEQGYWHCCSLFHNDEETAHKIMLTRTPYEAKEAARNIKGLSESEWYNETKLAQKQMYCLCKMKAEQHPHLKVFLPVTNKNNICEGSRNNTRWGVGLSVYDADIFKENKWQGQNWTREIWMKIIEELRG